MAMATLTVLAGIIRQVGRPCLQDLTSCAVQLRLDQPPSNLGDDFWHGMSDGTSCLNVRGLAKMCGVGKISHFSSSACRS
jgi:hypothetical protein